MTDDKTRAEFEKEFPLPDDCEWDGIEAYCWVYTRAPHPHNKHWEGWQAAKARYGQMDDAHTFLAGKVLVPVEVIDKALTAIRNELESAYEQAFPVCCGRSGEECCGSPAPDWPEQAKATMENLGQVEKELANALTASKGE